MKRILLAGVSLAAFGLINGAHAADASVKGWGACPYGGDPYTQAFRRHSAKQRVLFIGSSLFLVGLVTVLYTVLNS